MPGDGAQQRPRVSGTGSVFCAGADLTGMRADAGWAEVHDGRGELARLFRTMWELGKPIVARVRGYALAGGFGLHIVGSRVSDAASESLRGLGVIGIALGAGFVISAIISFVISRRLGLIEPGQRAAMPGAR